MALVHEVELQRSKTTKLEIHLDKLKCISSNLWSMSNDNKMMKV